MGKVIEGGWPRPEGGSGKIEVIDQTGGGKQSPKRGGGGKGGSESGGGGEPPKKRGLRDSKLWRGALAALALGGGAGEWHGRQASQTEAYSRGEEAGEKAGFEKGHTRGKQEGEEAARERFEKLRADEANSLIEQKKKQEAERKADSDYADVAFKELNDLYLAVKFGGAKSARGREQETAQVEKKIALIKAREIMANYRRWQNEKYYRTSMAEKLVGLLPTGEIKNFAAQNPDFKKILVDAGVEIMGEIEEKKSEIDRGEDKQGKKLSADDKQDNRYIIINYEERLRALNPVLAE